MAEALAVADGKIVYVGNNVNANDWVSDTTQVLDLSGKTVVPGFIEGHGHLMSMGWRLKNLDLTKVKSFDEILLKVAKKVSTSKKGEWIVGEGWHQDKWNSKPDSTVAGFPIHTQLSEIAPDNPVLLEHASGHSVLVNDAAMKMASITDETPDPSGGVIIRNLLGQATGLMSENAAELIYDIMPDKTDDDNIETLNLAIEECLKNGVTSFQDAGASQKTINLYHSFLKNELLKIRLYVMIAGKEEQLVDNWMVHGPSIGLGDNFLTIRAIKLYADGALGSRGALLIEDYTDDPGNTGARLTSPDYIMRVSEKAFQNGFQVCTHSIGDKANKEILDMYEIVLNSDTTKADLRFRIEHAQHIAAEDIPRFGQLGVIPSMQAIHMSSDRPWAINRLGQERIEEGAYVWRKLMDSGATIVNGTDVPVEPINPIANFYASVTRKTLKGTPEKGYEPTQKMTREEALRSITINNAYGAFEEDIKGCIEVGKLADLTVLSQDIMTIAEDEILNTEVMMTIVNGKVEFIR